MNRHYKSDFNTKAALPIFFARTQALRFTFTFRRQKWILNHSESLSGFVLWIFHQNEMREFVVLGTAFVNRSLFEKWTKISKLDIMMLNIVSPTLIQSMMWKHGFSTTLMSQAHLIKQRLWRFHIRFILQRDKKSLGKLKNEIKKPFVLTSNRIFTSRDIWVEKAKKYCATYTWGGSYTTKWY